MDAHSVHSAPTAHAQLLEPVAPWAVPSVPSAPPVLVDFPLHVEQLIVHATPRIVLVRLIPAPAFLVTLFVHVDPASALLLRLVSTARAESQDPVTPPFANVILRHVPAARIIAHLGAIYAHVECPEAVIPRIANALHKPAPVMDRTVPSHRILPALALCLGPAILRTAHVIVLIVNAGAQDVPLESIAPTVLAGLPYLVDLLDVSVDSLMPVNVIALIAHVAARADAHSIPRYALVAQRILHLAGLRTALVTQRLRVLVMVLGAIVARMAATTSRAVRPVPAARDLPAELRTAVVAQRLVPVGSELVNAESVDVTAEVESVLVLGRDAPAVHRASTALAAPVSPAHLERATRM